MIKRAVAGLGVSLIAVVAACVAAPAANAAYVVDLHLQAGTQTSCVYHVLGPVCQAHGAAQTIVAAQTGELMTIDLDLARTDPTLASSLTIEVHAGTPGGPLLRASNPVSTADIPIGATTGTTDGAGPVTFTLEPIEVTAGDVLAIVIPWVPDALRLGWTQTDSAYPGGSPWTYNVVSDSWTQDPAGPDLTVGTHMHVGPSMFSDTVGSKFYDDIEWMYSSALSNGCTDYLHYCPTSPLTRGQMAAFLDRALHLPATSKDYFIDDETSKFEANINRLAASHITSGCAAKRYCPTRTVTRGQMAAFLDRALHLPKTSKDYFSDDETSTFEASINRLAAAGITSGCTATTFCPTGTVTRGQMAAFLHRALG